MLHWLDVATSCAATWVRLGSGGRVAALGARPERPLELYEFEGCPYCRKVREALSALDLEAVIYPCPRGGPRFREVVKRRGGKAQFPYLVDPDAGVEMYESDAIVRHLFERYGRGPVPALLAPGPLTLATAGLASALRFARGVHYRSARAPDQPLHLYSFEACPFCRIVRECLTSLELPYRLHNLARGSPGRGEFARRCGRMQVPFLSDPNTGKELFESRDIVRYLEATYARAGPGA